MKSVVDKIQSEGLASDGTGGASPDQVSVVLLVCACTMYIGCS